jgi:predicted transcriptional regulator
MSNRQRILDLVSKMPEDATMDQILEKVEFVAGIQIGLEQAERGEGIPAEEARALVEKWAARSS